MIKNTNCKDNLLTEFKSLLNKDKFSTQMQLAKALEKSGFKDMSQTKVARLIKKCGAIKVKGDHKSYFYQIPKNPNLINIDKKISTVVTGINHNNNQVVIKTVKGGALIIGQMIESQSKELGILGCLACDNTILIIPIDTKNLDGLIHALIKYLFKMR